MSKLDFEYVPLTFISDKEEIKKQIRNTLILIHLLEKYQSPSRLEKLIEGTQYGYNASALQSGKNKFLRISDIHESKVDWDSVPFCNCDDEKTYLLKKDDILIARTGGTTGKSFKIDNPPKCSIYAGYLIRIRAKETVNPDYIYLFLHSFAYWSQIVNLNERNFRPKANAENLKALIIPNCDKAIQNDAVLVSKGEKIKGYEDLYIKIEKALSEYDKSQTIQSLLTNQFTQLENLNQAILQEAVQGKLVPQNPTDEPASQLLKRIKAEKEKSGKKGKPLPSIKPEEIPFEIPESWVWCRLGDAVYLKRGKSKHRPRNDNKLFANGTFPFIQTGDVSKAKHNNDLITTINGYYNEFGLNQSEIQPEGTLCITIAANIAECGFLDFDACVPDSVVCLLAIDKSIEKYVYHYLKLAKADLERFAPATAQKNINLGILNDLIIPFPPISELKRIVTEIEKQLAKTKQLKEHIIANQQATEQLLKALLHEAFEVHDAKEVKAEEKEAKVIELKCTPTNVDYYKRTVLAAEIVWQLHQEPTLGHVKLQKLIYLCQKTAGMQLPTNFLRQAMGPYDPQMMRSIDKQLKEKKWFEYNQTATLKYQPLEKAGQHYSDFEKYFSTEQSSIQFILDTFKSVKSDFVEIIATLYACLENLQNENTILSEAILFQRFYEWSDEKKKFEENELRSAYKKMIELGIVPR